MSKNRTINMIFRYLNDEDTKVLDDYFNSIDISSFKEIYSIEELKSIIDKYNKEYLDILSYEEIDLLRSYTGYFYKEINAISRNNWNYEKNGLLTKEKEQDYRNRSNEISNIINKLPDIKENLITYRGVNLNTFHSYGIYDIKDLLSLKGDYFYDEGFTSTSLIRSNSFFNKKLDYHEDCNVQIEYYIPENVNDCAILNNNLLSYSPNQTELLINRSNLSKIVDVIINDNNTATIKMVYIPERIWDPNVRRENEYQGRTI